MNEIAEKGLTVAKECANELGMQIVSVDYVMENGIKILRVICESTENLSIDEVSQLNELISNKLDEEDFIDEEYYLEVSSEGIEKELRTDNDIVKAIGKYVCVKTYEKIDGIKEIYGDLLSFNDGILKISYLKKNINKQIEISKSSISKIRLAVKF